MHSTRLQNTSNDHKPKPRSSNQTTRSLPVSKSSCVTSRVVPLVDHSRNSSPFSDSKHFVCSTCHKCVFNANHDACITKLLKEVNSRAKIQSHKTRNSNKLVDQNSHTQKPSRLIFTGNRSSPDKSSAVHERPITPRSCLGGNRRVEFSRLLVLGGFQRERYSPLAQSRLTVLLTLASTSFNPKKERLGTTLQAPFLKEKKGVRFRALYLQKKRNLLMASEHSSLGPALHEMTPAIISSGLVPKPPPSTSVDLPAPKVIAPVDEVVALVPVVSTGSPSSINVDQDVPSPSNSQTTLETQPPVIPNDVEENNHDIEVAHMGNDPYFGVLIPEVPSDQSSSSDSIHLIVHPEHQISEHNNKWTKDHPLENIIGALERPVSTRLQLHEQALFCYYDAFLTAVEPKT
ncbi:hypothetical protein Tco_0835131 [Tanacetum coccineum]